MAKKPARLVVAQDNLPTARWPAASVQMRAVAALVPYARNARTHSEAQVAEIAASIEQFGWTIPVLVAEDATIIAGHGRVMAAAILGLEFIPTMVAVGWTEAQRRAYTLADNKIALNAGWDDDLLKIELSELVDLGIDPEGLGFSTAELATLFDAGRFGNTDPDDLPSVPTLSASKPGDVWLCGPHRVMCGSATSAEDVATLLAGKPADLVWTDPPYNVDIGEKNRMLTRAGKGAKADLGDLTNDKMASGDFRAFLTSAFRIAFDALKPGGPIYVAHADLEGLNFRNAFADAGFKLSSCLIWVKNVLLISRSDYHWRHEPILYGWKPGAGHKWFGGRKQSTALLDEEGSAFGQNPDGSITVRIGGEVVVISGSDLKVEAAETTIIRCEKPRAAKGHPTQKPVDLISRMVRSSSKKGDLVLDPFGGSGSTLIACETLGRQARLIELDPKFVDVIVRRWQDFAGGVAVREADGVKFDAVEPMGVVSDG